MQLNPTEKSRFIAFVDESGDHSMEKIDEEFPIFVLIILIVERVEYIEKIIPAFIDFKLSYWDHEGVNLRSYDIKKTYGPFSILKDEELRKVFLEHLNILMEDLPYTLFIGCIKKKKLSHKYKEPYSPYDLALTFCLERVIHFLKQKNEPTIRFIFEKRGKKEDSDLESVFNKVITSGTSQQRANQFSSISWSLEFKSKKDNIVGLQMADLCAHPTARHILKPNQQNRAYEILEKHIYRRESRSWTGLKIFP